MNRSNLYDQLRTRAFTARRVVRGGSYRNNARRCRSAYRNANEPENRNRNIGFRLAAAQPWAEPTADPALEARGCSPARVMESSCVSRRVDARSNPREDAFLAPSFRTNDP